MSDAALSQIAECAAADTNIHQVQEYIRDVFADFEPGEAHKILPKLNWAGIVSTNYDTYVEDAYALDPRPKQDLNPYVYDGQDPGLNLNSTALNYLKIHGCVNNMAPHMVPLVLSADQYLDVEDGRKSLFNTLEEWALKYTFVFVGYGVQDLDIRKYVTRLVDNIDNRMRFYLVRPSWSEYETKFWGIRKVTTIEANFDQFLKEVDSLVDSSSRTTRVLTKTPPALMRHFDAALYSLSANTSNFLDTTAEFVEGIEKNGNLTSDEFFKGNSAGWDYIISGWDVGRDVVEDIILDVVLDDHFYENGPSLILLRGYAGSGKTVAMKRLAWEISHEHQGVVIHLSGLSDLNPGAISELIQLTKKRLFVCIDDVSINYSNLRNCVQSLGGDAGNVTFIGGTRSNDWARVKRNYEFIKIFDYELGNLSHKEIVGLLSKLESEKCLGELERLDQAGRIAAFRDTADKNLLVALYEATKGKSFEEIVLDEYETLVSEEARRVYLTICVLNRLRVPVRATLIARIHKIQYTQFTERLFEPLAGVVFNEYSKKLADYVYYTRHPYIAEIIFLRVLVSQSDRFEEYHEVISALNLSYDSDNVAFRELVRGRVLNDLFSQPEYVDKIYQIAEEKSSNDFSIFHQRGVFEMNRNGGSLERAQEYLDRALALAPRNNLVRHSAAELLLKKGEAAGSPLLQERLLRKAERLCLTLREIASTSHVRHTLAKISLARARVYLQANQTNEDVGALRELVKNAQREVDFALQTHPGDSYLLHAKSKFSKLLGDSSLVLSSLEAAFKSNPHIGYIAIQLHECYLQRNDTQRAADVLRECLRENRQDRAVNFAFGKFLMDQGETPNDSMVYLKRSFVPGDPHLDAQLRYGREAFRAKEYTECERHFGTVRGTRFPPKLGTEAWYPIDQIYNGTVVEIHSRYLLVRDTESGLRFRAYRDEHNEDIFSSIIGGGRLRYKIAVGVHGLRGIDLTMVGRAGGNSPRISPA